MSNLMFSSYTFQNVKVFYICCSLMSCMNCLWCLQVSYFLLWLINWNLNLKFIRAVVLNQKYLIHHKWLIKHPGHLSRKTSFWMGACLERVLDCTWAFIKKIKTSFTQVQILHKTTKLFLKFIPKVITKIPLFLFQLSAQFELVL